MSVFGVFLVRIFALGLNAEIYLSDSVSAYSFNGLFSSPKGCKNLPFGIYIGYFLAVLLDISYFLEHAKYSTVVSNENYVILEVKFRNSFAHRKFRKSIVDNIL